ncbi:uncharacterized protein LOC106653711 [Trichogramma pretiosum]|uniref:uncharacterized protein LOC106653711 n=1 Tax=Trichogramma pretiosum TaxID=7493 RepID=UPI0006C956AC|nr:uncharacterized protein LOC106653711 [Trichogramma pretiosum]
MTTRKMVHFKPIPLDHIIDFFSGYFMMVMGIMVYMSYPDIIEDTFLNILKTDFTSWFDLGNFAEKVFEPWMGFVQRPECEGGLNGYSYEFIDGKWMLTAKE